MRKRSWLKTIALLMAMAFILSCGAGCGGSSGEGDTDGKIVVGSKDYNENIILGEMLAQVIEAKTDLQVERKLNLGATMVCWEALKKGELDLYPDYTGTGLMHILKEDVIKDPDEVYKLVQKEYKEKYSVKWLEPFGFNNTYATAVPRELAEELDIKTNSDLAAHAPDLVFGCEQEYLNRKDGFPDWAETYGVEFKDIKTMDYSLKYEAAYQGQVQVVDAFSTDGELVAYDMKVLEDDKGYFPPYYAASVVRMDTLEKYPELEGVLNSLAGKIDEASMQQLNYLVKEEGQDTAEVVNNFLTENGVI